MADASIVDASIVDATMVDAGSMVDAVWLESYDAVSRIAGLEQRAPLTWHRCEERMRHVCRVIASELDATELRSARRGELARAYARAFGLMCEAARRRVETLRPPP